MVATCSFPVIAVESPLSIYQEKTRFFIRQIQKWLMIKLLLITPVLATLYISDIYG
jgi:hypothetical protein